MKEEIFMAKEISVILQENELGEDILMFNLAESIPIKLNDNDQSYLRLLYKELIILCFESDIILKLSIKEGYKKNLFESIAKSFIKELNSEITKIRNDENLEKLKTL